MTKEQEAYKRLQSKNYFVYSPRFNGKSQMEMDAWEQRQKDFETVGAALKKYEQLKIDYEEMDRINDELNLSNHELCDKCIKYEKALEIIKEKHCIHILALKGSENWRAYNEFILPLNRYNGIKLFDKLTQKEYELLKEILENEK